MTGSVRLHESLGKKKKISNVDRITPVSFLGASSRRDLMSSFSSQITASGTGAIIKLMVGLRLVKGEDWSRGDFIHRISQKEDLHFELYLSWGKGEV